MAASPPTPPPVKRRAAPKRPKAAAGSRKKKTNAGKNKPPISLVHSSLLIGLEGLGLLGLGLTAVVVLLGYSFSRFSGTGFFSSYLPFAAGILSFILVAVLILGLWLRARRWLLPRSSLLPSAVVFVLVLLIVFLVPPELFSRAFLSYQILVGGKEEAGRVAVAHQVFAAYRRLEIKALARMMGQAEPYMAAIEEAGAAHGIDGDLLKGLAAVESSFLPRSSPDGGHGLFQITRIPAAVTTMVDPLFDEKDRLFSNVRYNAHLGAATLKHYLTEMKGDLFLGLLAYNIGPANGGLRCIMEQYGATDFITIQPYLMQLPRDYPIRVLAYSLAFRVGRREGRLLAYEEGLNAVRIQAIGIPGLR